MLTQAEVVVVEANMMLVIVSIAKLVSVGLGICVMWGARVMEL